MESLNGSLKNFYTELTATGSITGLIEIMVNHFVPDQLSTYRRLKNVVSQCLTRFAYAANFSGEHIYELSRGLLLVKCETEESLYYTLDLGSPENLLSCSCDDFIKSLLCKQSCVMHIVGIPSVVDTLNVHNYSLIQT